MKSNSRILIAGSNGCVGSAIVRKLKEKGYNNLYFGTRKEVDFTNQLDTLHFFNDVRPKYVFLAAARVGGIMDNKTYPANFIYDNLMIQSNIINCSHKFAVKKLLFLGSSCIYPRLAEQPIKEDALMTGKLEPTNEAYAVAKIAGIQLCKSYRQQHGSNFISAQPCNIYGPFDTFNETSSHVVGSLLYKFHNAKINNEPSVECWGDGTPYREFLHVEDLADACLHLMKFYEGDDIVNVGPGVDYTIKQLAEKVAKVVGYNGEIKWDTSKPNGMPRKLLDVERLHNECHWKHVIELDEGLEKTYKWYLENN